MELFIKIHLRLLVVVLFIFLIFYPVTLADGRSTYIVHMDKSFMPKAFVDHTHWYTSIVNSLKDDNKDSLILESSPPSQILYIHNNVMHGFSAVLSNGQLKALKKSRGFVSAYGDTPLKLHTTRTPQFIGLNPVTGLWPASRFGTDVIVGVIDSGVWPESQSFKDDGMADIPTRWKGICQPGQEFDSSMCNKKLIGVRYFNKGFLAAHPNITLHMNSGRDTDGHGTLTSSIVAGNYVRGASFFGYANGTAKGVAPGARLAIYKVYWEFNGTNFGATNSDLVASMDQAVADGVDVISISIGDEVVLSNLYESPYSTASFGAMKKGILVSIAAGNAADIGSISNGYPWVLTVAGGTIDRFLTGKLTLGNGITIYGWTTFPASSSVKNFPLIYNKTLSSCNSTEALSSVKHGIVICEYGDLYNQMYNLHMLESNDTATIFISDDPWAYVFIDFPIPGVLINSKDAKLLMRYMHLSVQKPTASMEFQRTLLGTKPAPVVAPFSSQGPSRSYQDILKPDIMAPGELVLGAAITNIEISYIGTNISLTSDFTLESGTSFACPHVSGIAALLKSVHPEWSPAAIRSAIMTTANPLDNTGRRIQDSHFEYEEATPLAMGSGHVDPNRALDPGLVYDVSPQDYVDFVCSLNYTRAQTQTIVGADYKCSGSRCSSDLNYPSFIALFTSKERYRKLIKTFKRTVTYVGKDVPVTYRFKLEEPKGSKINIWPKTLSFRKKNEKQSYFMTIAYEAFNDSSSYARHGSLTWVDDFQKHTVRSPIVVCPRIE